MSTITARSTIAHPNVRLIRTTHSVATLCQGCPRTIPADARRLVALTPSGPITLESHYCNARCRRVRLSA